MKSAVSFATVALLCVLVASTTGRVSGVIVGGVKEVSTEDAAHTNAAAVAIQKLNAGNGANNLGLQLPLQLEALKSVSTQVVAGTLYYITMAVKDAAGKVADVTVQLWSKPWLERSNDATVAGQAWQLTKAQLAA